MPYSKMIGWLASWLHRKGISRRINGTFDGRRGGWAVCTVDTIAPWRWLANIANRWETPLVHTRKRVDRCRWRWVFIPNDCTYLAMKRGREYENGPIHHAKDCCRDHV